VALDHLGQLVEAADELGSVLADASASDVVLASASDALAALEPRIPRARIAVAGSLDGVRLEVDGRSLAPSALGAELPLNPGRHRVSALREEDEVASVEFTLLEAQRVEIALAIPARAPVDGHVASLALAPPPRDDSVDPLALGLGIGGGVLLLGGTLTLVVALTVPSEPAPFVGNAGILEIRP
jgi:hypothetical protein